MRPNTKKRWMMKATMVAMVAGIMLGISPAKSQAAQSREIRGIGDQDADYVLSAMERMTGKAILLPEVIAMVGVLRYAEATDNKKLIQRVAALYKAAYLDDGCLNRLSSGHIESQATAIIPLELYRLTGDESLLKDCWRTVQGQMRGAKAEGVYRHACASSGAQFAITLLQMSAYRVYGDKGGLKFAASNLETYFKNNTAKGKQFFDNWVQWDKEGSLVGYSLTDLERTLPPDHPMRTEYNDQYVPTMGSLDQEGSLASISAVELAKVAGPDMKALMDMYRKIAGADAKRLGSGTMKTDNMFPFMQLAAMATGVRNGYLTDTKYRALLDAKWAEFAKDYQAPELWSWNVVYKPLLRSGGRLLFATAMLELDKKPAALKTRKVVSADSLKRTFSKKEIDTALNVWGDLRYAEAADDANAIAKTQKSFEFDSCNPLDLLVEMELVRLTDNDENERKVIETLHDLLLNPLADKEIHALIFSQAFRTYGTVKFAEAAGIQIDDSPLVEIALAKMFEVVAKIPTDIVDTSDAMKLYKLGLKADANDADQMRSLCEQLQAPTGFFKHSMDSNGLCWSRASGQAIAGVTAFLKALPKDHPQRAYFLRVFKNFAYAAERTQDHDGLWHVLPEDFNSPQDTLGSAFFVASLATGLEQKWIHRLEFREIVDLGWKGVQANVTGGKLTNAVVASAPRKVASSYALLPRIIGDALGQEALQTATAATKSYYASDVPGSEEDKMAVLGSMHEQLENLYEGKLPDGRTLKHISTKASFDITKVLECRGKKKAKIIQSNPDIYGENDFRLTGYEILDKEKIQALPEAILKLKYPVAGITVWLEDNPSVHTVSDDLGYCVLSMPYVALAEGASGSKILAQIPGFKPVPASQYRSYISEMVEEVDDAVYSKTPEGPSDKISGKLLAPVVLAHHRAKRKELLAMLGKTVKEVAIDDGVILRPVYLRGKIISAADGKAVDEASVWLKRNPFLLHRTGIDGEFEVMRAEAPLYEQTSDALMITAPGYRPTEVSIASYLADNLSVKMQPLNYNPAISSDTTLPTVRIPGGFFRMGRGVTQHGRGDGDPSTRDYDTRNCWPVRTAYLPSFYFAQFQHNKQMRKETLGWAIKNGYECGDIGSFAFPLLANAISEREGFTPCYYTADKKVIRRVDQLTERLTCNWRADGYRLPTFAEWTYAARAGRTTGQFYGDDGDKFRDYFISARASKIFEGHSVFTMSPARRLALDWGIYDAHIGQSSPESPWDLRWWRVDEHYFPTGCTLRAARFCERLSYGGRARTGRIGIGVVDNLETQWYDEWPGNPIGFQFSGYANHLQNATVFIHKADTMTASYCSRFVRTAENVCNDIRLLKTRNDPTQALPGSVDIETVGTTIDMAKIPAATFSMGSANQASWPNEGMAKGISVCSAWPEHEVSVSAFEISTFEITVAQWRDVQKWAKKKGYTDLPDGDLGTSSSEDLRHPVVNVNWFDVIKWCNAASEKIGQTPCYNDADGNVYRTGETENPTVNWQANGYRLPTEAQWEYATMTGVDAVYYWGDFAGSQYAWQHSRKGVQNSGNTSHPVGQRIGNRFGLYDTVGNVWEWCWDWTAPYPMTADATLDPKGPSTRDDIKAFFEEYNPKKLKKAKIKLDPKSNIPKSMARGGTLKRHAGRALRGSAYNLGNEQHAFFEAQHRGSRKPDQAKDTVGFRVVIGGKAAK